LRRSFSSGRFFKPNSLTFSLNRFNLLLSRLQLTTHALREWAYPLAGVTVLYVLQLFFSLLALLRVSKVKPLKPASNVLEVRTHTIWATSQRRQAKLSKALFGKGNGFYWSRQF
jgi:hypothetical protein